MIFQNTIPLIKKRINPIDLHITLCSLRKVNSQSLMLSSCGGSSENFVIFGRYFLDRKLSIIGRNNVDSVALSLFLCGEKRVAMPDTQFLIHENSLVCDSGGRVTKGEAQMRALIHEHQREMSEFFFWSDVYQTLRQLDAMYAELVSYRTALSAATASSLMYEGHCFGVEEALECGIIHGIIEDDVPILSQLGVFNPW
jgi:ATP-dependent protease ClpP protease subunit